MGYYSIVVWIQKVISHTARFRSMLICYNVSELSKNLCFKLAALNITSFPGHIEELRIYMNTECIDILAVTKLVLMILYLVAKLQFQAMSWRE